MTITINGSGTITGATTLASTIASPTMSSATLTTPTLTTPTLSSPVTSGTPTGVGVLTSGTVNAGGTNPFPSSGGPPSVDFTSIPSWVKRITVMFSGVSTSGTSLLQVQLGTSAGATTTGYLADVAVINAGTGQTSATTGHYVCTAGSASFLFNGCVVFTNISGNSWVGSGITRYQTGGSMAMHTSTISLAAILDRVRITTVNGTDTFDAGSINILYE